MPPDDGIAEPEKALHYKKKSVLPHTQRVETLTNLSNARWVGLHKSA
jgi:hypothetical protein